MHACLKRECRVILTFFFLFLLVSGCGPREELPRYARVSWVIDGDTVVISGGQRVRYLGIDTPELSDRQPWAKDAYQRNRQLVEGKMVRLEYDVEKKDRFGRLLAFVWVEDLLVNEELVKEGLAYVYYIYPNEKYGERLKTAQAVALREKKGLWGFPGVISPDDMPRWEGFNRAVKGRVCRVVFSGKGVYLVLDCDPENWRAMFLPYSHFVNFDLDSLKGWKSHSVLGIGKIDCGRKGCYQLLLDRYQVDFEGE